MTHRIKKVPRRALAKALAVTVVLGCITLMGLTTALAADSVAYLDENGNDRSETETEITGPQYSRADGTM